MKLKRIDPPRVFGVGVDTLVRLKDCAHIELETDEQVTFFTESGAEYDVVRKSWGFFATPSLNKRLTNFGLRAAMIVSLDKKYFVVIVEVGKEKDFEKYQVTHKYRVVAWLDSDEHLQSLDRKVHSSA